TDLGRAESSETDDGWLVDVVSHAARGYVLALVSNVRSRNDKSGSELSLHREVPGIHGGQSHGVVASQWQDIGIDLIGQDWVSIGSLRLRRQNRGRIECRRALR